MHFGHRSLDKHSTSDKCNLLQAKVGRLKESDVYQEESMLMFIKRPLKSKYITSLCSLECYTWAIESYDPTRTQKGRNQRI